jgi:hypothetical protein
VYTFLVAKPEGKVYLGDLGIDGKDNIKVNYREIWLEGVDWIHLAQDMSPWQTFVRE